MYVLLLSIDKIKSVMVEIYKRIKLGGLLQVINGVVDSV
jgi:hypothetical protein